MADPLFCHLLAFSGYLLTDMMTEEMPAPQQNDVELVAESLNGNQDAFRQIVERYQTLIRSLAYYATGNLSQSDGGCVRKSVPISPSFSRIRKPTTRTTGDPSSLDYCDCAPRSTAARMTALKAGLGWLLPSNKSGLPLARQESASFTPQKVTSFTDFSCFRNARKSPA